MDSQHSFEGPSTPAWPPARLVPEYCVREERLIEEGADSECRVESVEARFVFDDWFGREVSIFARRSYPTEDPNGGGVLHIVGGAQTLHPEDLAVWTREGYAAASFDWQLTGVGGRPPERSSRFPEGVVPQFSATAALENAVIPIAVQAAAVCLDWLGRAPGVDPRRLGVVGISWGGYLSWILAAYDRRVRAIVPAFGCGGLFAPNRESAAHAPEVRDFWAQHWEPAGLGPRITAPACYLNGTNDFFGEPEVAEKLLATLNAPHVRSYLPNVDHSLSPAQTRLAKAWLDRHLLDGPDIPASPGLEAAAPGNLWWTADLAKPSMYRSWHNGLPPTDREVLAFTQNTCDGLEQSCPLVRISPDAAPVSPETSEWIPFGLGWRWELGNTRHFNNNAMARAPETADRPWLVTPARPGNDETTVVLIHPATLSHDALELAWSAEPRAHEVVVRLHVCHPFGLVHEGRVRWSPESKTLYLAKTHFPTLATGLGSAGIGRIEICAQQRRTPFEVGPLRSRST